MVVDSSFRAAADCFGETVHCFEDFSVDCLDLVWAAAACFEETVFAADCEHFEQIPPLVHPQG